MKSSSFVPCVLDIAERTGLFIACMAGAAAFQTLAAASQAYMIIADSDAINWENRLCKKAEVCSSFITTTVREQRPRSHHKGATGRVRTCNQQYQVLCEILVVFRRVFFVYRTVVLVDTSYTLYRIRHRLELKYFTSHNFCSMLIEQLIDIAKVRTDNLKIMTDLLDQVRDGWSVTQ